MEITKHNIIKIFCLLFVAYIIVYPLELEVLLRLIMLAIYIVVGGICFEYLKVEKVNKKDFFCYSFCIILISFEMIYYSIDLNYKVLQSILCFVFLMLITVAQKSFICDKLVHRYFFLTAFASSIIISVYSLFPFAYYFRGTSTRCIYLTLNLDNSNFTGIILFYLFSVLWMERLNHRYKWATYSMLAYLLYLIYLSNSRTCLGVALLLSVYSIFFAKKKIPKWLIIIALITPFVFFPLYLKLSSYGSDAILFMGKRVFSGRQDEYTKFLAFLNTRGKWLFGNMKEFFFANALNGPLAIICSTGITGTIFFYTLNFKYVIDSGVNAKTTSSRIAVIGMMAIAIHSCTESSLVLGGVVSLFIYFTYFVLSHDIEMDAK